MIAPNDNLATERLHDEAAAALARMAGGSRLGAMDGAYPQGSGGYDAVASKGRRRPPRSDLRSEDWVLPSVKRRKLVATHRDIIRNFALAGWMIRCHLDYVARFHFQPKTGDPETDKALAKIVKRWSKAGNFETSGRFSRQQAMRISEARKVIDGDVFWMKIVSGLVQIIEGDRVLTPPGGVPTAVPYKPTDFVHGIAVDQQTGRMKAACLCKRQRDGVFAAEWGGGLGGYVFERVVDAANIWQHACWETTCRVDQVRGISPLSSSSNSLQDVYEGVDLAFAKAKVAQMFGLIIFRQAVEESEGWAARRASSFVGDEEGDGSGDSGQEAPPQEGEDDERYDVDPGAGPFKLELKDRDRAEFLHTNTPETELLNFMGFVTHLALLSIDLPLSFFDGSKVNYYGKKVDLQQYENSSKSKRESNQTLQEEWFEWRLAVAVAAGEPDVLALLASVGGDVANIQGDWVPTAMPWIDKLRDIKADQLAIAGGQDSRVRVARRYGMDAHELAREEMAFERWLIDERKKLKLPDLPITEPLPTGKGNDQQTNHDDNQSASDDAEIERLEHAF